MTTIVGISSEVLSLKIFLDSVLAQTVAIFQSYSVPVPTRRYWTLGDPVVDDEQLCVNLVQMYLGAPGDEARVPRRTKDPITAVLSISVSRAVPVGSADGRAPLASDIQTAAEISAVDSYTLIWCAKKLDVWNSDSINPLGLGVIATVEAPEAQGGFFTTKMQLTIAVP